MTKRSKRHTAAMGLLEKNRRYAIQDAVELLQKFPATKFDESVTLALRLGIDASKSDQIVRGAFSLPHGIGKSVVPDRRR